MHHATNWNSYYHFLLTFLDFQSQSYISTFGYASVQIHVHFFHCVRQAGVGGWSWNGVREKYCWAGWSWRLELQRCERKKLQRWRAGDQPNAVSVVFFCLALAQNRSTSLPLFSHLPFTNNKLFKVQHVKLLEKRSNTYRGIYILTSILLSFQVIAILAQDQV